MWGIYLRRVCQVGGSLIYGWTDVQDQVKRSHWDVPVKKQQSLAVKYWREVKNDPEKEKLLLRKLKSLAISKSNKSV